MLIQVKVIPNSKKSEVVRIGKDSFKIKVDERAEEGRANRRLIEILADYFNIDKSSISILKGFKGKNKIIEIKNL